MGKACLVCGHRRYCHLSPTGCWKIYNEALKVDPIATIPAATDPLSTRDPSAIAARDGVRSAAK